MGWKPITKSILCFLFLSCIPFYAFLRNERVTVTSQQRNADINTFQPKHGNNDESDILVVDMEADELREPAIPFSEETSASRDIYQKFPSSSKDDSFIKNTYQNVLYKFRTNLDENFIRYLGRELKTKLAVDLPENATDTPHTCTNKTSIENSCDEKGCLQTQLPKDPMARVEQLVKPAYMRPSNEYKKVLDDMRDSVEGRYDIILATGASSNHYLESKALLANLHTNVFPYFKNITLIYYDLGLTDVENADITKMCKLCHIRKFPFSRFPETFSLLKCYGWKPMIVYAHASRANLLYWMDASIRFLDDPSYLKELFRRATVRGIQSGATQSTIPRVTLQSMFHFFGDEACAYHPYTQCTSGLVIFHNEPLVLEAIIAPWAACALNETCMCPSKMVDLKKAIVCGRFRDLDPYVYGRCHRFDQSALATIVRKLFQEKSHHVLNENIRDYLRIERGDQWVEDKVGLDAKKGNDGDIHV